MNKFTLTPGRIVIIGASSGLGRQLALDFADKGWQVGVAARRTELLEALAAERPDHIRYASIDATRPDAGEQLQQLADSLGGMDVMLYAAGTGWGNADLEPGHDAATVAVNVDGFTRMINAAYHYFTAAGRGHIAAITSIGGTKGIGITAAYSASKSYQATYLQALRQLVRLKHRNIAITDIRPGFIDTALITGHRYPMTMRVSKVAREIARAIVRGRKVVVVDWRWRMVTMVWRLCPDWLWRRLGGLLDR